MADIITTKNGRLHIYVRQDKYKGKLKSENWVGRTFHNGKQKVISSGTTNLEEAKVILEKWYDDLISGSIPENGENKLKDVVKSDADNLTTQRTTQPESQSQPEVKETQVIEKKNDNLISQNTVPKPEEKKKSRLNLSFFQKMFSKKGVENKKKKDSFSNIKKIFGERISKANIANEEIAGIDISENSIKVAQLSKSKDDNWILEKISLRLLDKAKTTEGIIASKDYVAEELKLTMANAKITTSNVAISIPVTSAIIRVVTSPLMTDEELQKAIETDSLWENLVQLTDDLNDYSVFHQIISRNQKLIQWRYCLWLLS